MRRGQVPLPAFTCRAQRRGLRAFSTTPEGHVRMPKGLWCLGLQRQSKVWATSCRSHGPKSLFLC